MRELAAASDVGGFISVLFGGDIMIKSGTPCAIYQMVRS